MRTRANGCTRGNDTGDASGIRDGKTLPPVGPHRLLLPHRAATAAHRGLKELERTIVESTTILLGDTTGWGKKCSGRPCDWTRTGGAFCSEIHEQGPEVVRTHIEGGLSRRVLFVRF